MSGAHFAVDSIVGGRNSLKVRIDDSEHGVERIVSCEFSYRHSDERYGYAHIDLVTTGFGIKSRTHAVGRFPVTDHGAMKERVTKDIVACVRQSVE